MPENTPYRARTGHQRDGIERHPQRKLMSPFRAELPACGCGAEDAGGRLGVGATLSAPNGGRSPRGSGSSPSTDPPACLAASTGQVLRGSRGVIGLQTSAGATGLYSLGVSQVKGPPMGLARIGPMARRRSPSACGRPPISNAGDAPAFEVQADHLVVHKMPIDRHQTLSTATLRGGFGGSVVPPTTG